MMIDGGGGLNVYNVIGSRNIFKHFSTTAKYYII